MVQQRSYRTVVPLFAAALLVAGAVAVGKGGQETKWASRSGDDDSASVEILANVFLEDPGDETYREVPLKGLLGQGNRLDGVYVRASSDRLNPDGRSLQASSKHPDYRFEPNLAALQDCIRVLQDCSPFDVVNLYYHVDRFARHFWVDRLEFGIDFQAHAVAHVSGDGAFAKPDEHVIKFGLGSIFMQNAALEDETIYHEYTHLVTWEQGFHVTVESPAETRALNEGFAHYFAATYTDDPRIGEWLITCPERRHCTGPLNARELVTLQTQSLEWNWNDGEPSAKLKYGVCTRFHEDDGKCKTSYNNFDRQYVWAIIWGSALWDLREHVGPDVADFLIHRSIDAAHTSTTFSEALENLIAADAALYGGAHEGVIAHIFAARGISRIVDTSMEADDPRRNAVRIGVSPNPSSGTTSIRFETDRSTHLEISVYDALGRRVARLADRIYNAGSHVIAWEAAGVPSGRYHVVIDGLEKSISAPFTFIR